MKKWLVVLMTVLALCLMCSGAMAAEPKTWDLSTYDDFILIRPNDGDTITGSTELNVILSFNDDMTINFENVSIEGGLSTSDWENDPPRNVTINLVGSNKVKGPNSTWAVALGVYGSLTIDSIDGTGSLTIESATSGALYVADYNGTASFTLLNGTVTAIGCSTDSIYGEKYSGVFAEKSIEVKGGTLIASGGYACGTIDEDYTIPAAVQFNASTHEMTAGTNDISAAATSAYNGEKYMKIAPKANAGGGDPVPQPSAPTAPTAPKTGDESNIALWACLMTLSAIGLVVVGKKFKKAF